MQRECHKENMRHHYTWLYVEQHIARQFSILLAEKLENFYLAFVVLNCKTKP